jgi:hypothetical protein
MKIALGTLFPELELGFTNGYTADEHGYIWSTRQGTARKLTLQTYRVKHPYTCLNKPAGHRFGKAITASYSMKRADVIDRLAKFNLDAFGKSIPSHPTTLSATGYVVGSVAMHGLSFAHSPKIHKSLAEVRTETERLAKAYPGKTFVYLEIKGNCTAGGVTWS